MPGAELRSLGRTLVHPLVDENPITLQILGICSALAVTRSVETALAMSAAVTAVLIGSSVCISAIRHQIPRSVRLIVQITIIATLVILVDQVLQAFFWELSRKLSVFVGLIITNCIVLGRAESFAMHHGPAESAADALGNGLGYGIILLAIGATRELLGMGSLLGVPLLVTVDAGGSYQPLSLMLLPPSAFFLIGLLIWGIRSWKSEQVEPSEAATGIAADGAERPMSEALDLLLRAALVENLALSFFLGMCMFVAVSRALDMAFGFGLAVLAVQTVTVPLNHLIHEYLLRPGAWAWAGLPDVDLGFLGLVSFVGVIAAFVQILEMLLERFLPGLAARLGVFLPLVTVNCAILGGSLFMAERRYGFGDSVIYGFGSGLGWALAICLLAAIREKLRYADPPSGLQGMGLTFIVVGLVSMAFLGFAGIEIG